MNADDLAKILDELGRRLGPTGSHVFELAMRQIVINASISIGAFVILLVIGLVAARPLYRWVQGNSTYGYRDMVAVVAVALYGITMLMVTWFAVAGFANLLNPEYAAIRDLLGAVRR